MDKELLKQALKELFESKEIGFRLIPFRDRGIMYVILQVIIDDDIVFQDEPMEI